MQNRVKILIIEDDKQIRKMLSITLSEQGYQVMECSNKKDAALKISLEAPDIILLDLGLPDGDGKELISFIRERLSTPIVIISARDFESEIIACFELGVNDYVKKPFFTGELLARIKSALRQSLKEDIEPEIVCGELKLDITKRAIFLNDEQLKLTPTEYNLLKLMMINRGVVLTHKQLLIDVWGISYEHETQYLRVFINQLRKKIAKDKESKKHIRTESGIGYRFVCNE